MKKFKALIFAVKLGEGFGRYVECWAADAFEANAKFCRYCARLDRNHGQTFDFSHFQMIEE